MYKTSHYARRRGFTLIELLVVIAIIGVLSTLAIVALGSARQKARDSKRVADLAQVSKALEVYYSDTNAYPSVITPGQPLTSPDGATTYMALIPSNPTPRNDGSCPNSNYVYTYNGPGYTLLSCVGGTTGELSAGGFAVTNNGQVPVGTISGLVGYWRMDEGGGSTLYDSSGTGNHATLSGNPTWSGPGMNGGQFLTFDSSAPADYFSVPDNSSVDLSTGLTISLWYKVASGKMVTFGKYFSGVPPQRSYVMELYGDNRFYMSVSGDGNTVISQRSTAVVTADANWHHFATTYDGSSIVLYKDGAVLPSAIMAGTVPASIFNSNATSPLRNMYNTVDYTNGSMDNVRLYNRALTAAEVLELYTNRQ